LSEALKINIKPNDPNMPPTIGNPHLNWWHFWLFEISQPDPKLGP